jgi:thioredoxin reductase (NADPH)
MFTREELRGIPLFSDLADKDIEYLARTSADIHVLAGEYIVHEGDTRRALYAVVDGRIELTKFIDGAERVIGSERGPGELFGEVPVVLDSPYLASFRAVRRSRLMRVDARDFRVVAASAPKMAAAVEAAALERIEGLQQIAAAPTQPPLAIIGPQFDDATHELREFLQRNSVDFDCIEPDGPGNYPAVRLRDGTLLPGPSMRDIAVAIGLCVSPARSMYDVAIVGAGPAGLAAAVYGASEGLSTVLIECEAPGGQAGTSSRIENYLGFPYGVSGDELAQRALQQAKRLGAHIVVTRTVQRIDTDTRTLLLDGDEAVRAKTLVLATGVSWRRLNIASLERLSGRGVYYGAAPAETKFVQGKEIYLVGGGNSAGQAAINFANFADAVTLLVRAESLEKSMSYYLIEQLKT